MKDFCPSTTVNVARSLVLPLRGSSLSDPLPAPWSFSDLSIRGIARSPLYRACSLIVDAATSCRRRRYTRVNLIEWLKAMVGNRKSEELIDPNLPEKPSSKVLKLCSVDATKRPKIGQIIHMLEADEILFSDERRTGGESLRSHGNYHHEQKDSNRDRKQIGEEITD
ncbi:hypothetical protein Ahy_A10g050461 [Arachis hypogaea]|uniref:non-specific serine/threonine protein kinase n=1 Tax=Arachis hypogaea TaxID=3818 RepID=A0A445B9G3_ARAHY|nr:hypothetical protein Ahy_A10g050461 [Arachis hypogaea]